MTDQLTDQSAEPQAPTDQADAPAFAPPTRLDRAKSEIMAGGAVTENGEDEVAGGWQGFLALAAILGLFVWLAVVNIWIFVFVVGVVISIFLHEFGHFITARWTGMKVTQFFLFFGPRLVELPPRRDRVRGAGAATRGVRADHRDEPDGRGRPGRRSPYLPSAEFPEATARHLGRFDHAHPDRDRAAVRRVRLAGRADRAGRATRHRRGGQHQSSRPSGRDHRR